ncbi:multiple inositol polyphosphate phosphatase 1-like isoform X2 [Neocloeon triangulifer]|nr:multiple inositol polyphosphate phosphatase 1-like isoform X2 [Neocloeon triangulifer]
MTIRHGTRNPSKFVIESMQNILPSLRDKIVKLHRDGEGKLCDSEASNLLFWLPRLNISEEKNLVAEGERELEGLGTRVFFNFPELLSHEENKFLNFRYTDTQRTLKSALHFTNGMFGSNDTSHVQYSKSPHKHDPLLRFYKSCEKWKTEIDDHPDTGMLHQLAFKNGSEFSELKSDVANRLGLQDNALTILDIEIMYQTCAFESAWNENGTASPWCAVFSKENLQVLEYSSDLKYFWNDGYGYEINHEQACPMIQDMLANFKNASRATHHAKGVFYFTHSGALLKVLAHLGLYRDKEPLQHHNFDQHKSSRLWRVGRIDSFAANLAAVLYSCESTPKVLFLHQEQPVVVKGCPSEAPYLCPLQQLEELFPSCQFDQICKLPDSKDRSQ